MAHDTKTICGPVRSECSSCNVFLKGGSESTLPTAAFLPPANEVWGKVICLQVCVCPQEGCLVRGGGGCLVPGGLQVHTQG